MRQGLLGLTVALLAGCAATNPSDRGEQFTVERQEPVIAAQPSPATAATVPQPAPPLLMVDRAEQTIEPDVAETRGGRRLLALALGLRDNVAESYYRARTTVREPLGYYAWDCSGMASWMLRRAAPRSMRAVAKGRGLARDFYRAIDRAPLTRFRRGWKRLSHVSQVQPGDVFAFLRSPLSQSKITGHVGFVVGEPVELPTWPGAYAVRILDATRLPHQDDTRRGHAGGFGFGTMLFVTDDTGETVGYGWFGSASRGTLPTRVIYGRLQ